MSTKVFNAFRYEGTIEELMKYLPLIKEKHIQTSANMLFRCKDFRISREEANWLANDEIVALKDLSLLSHFLQQEARRCDNNFLNYDASAVVYFYKEKIYVQFFGLERDILHFVQDDDKFTSFWWENQTGELPDDCTEEEYEERGEIWNEILGESGIPSEIGLIYEFYNWWISHLIVTKFYDKVRKIPQINKRIRELKGEAEDV